jgi:4-amino-4-deoxy-L-arabinose transferase-like glycosyltransferase
MRRPRSQTLALAAILAVGIVLRLIGLQYGLPSVYNPDEVAIMARALSFAKGSLNPGNFLYPTFYFYVLFIWVGAYLGWLLLTGRAESIGDLQRLYFTAPTGIYTAGRALGVATGAATILALHRLGSHVADPRTAMAAAVFLAVAPLHVRDAHYVKHDVPATLAITLAYLAIARVWPAARVQGPSTRDSLLAGAACGVAFSTHYYCVFLAAPLAAAIVMGWHRRGSTMLSRQLGLAAVASVAVFLALSPFVALEPLTAWRDITANREIVVDRAVRSGAFAPAIRYSEMLWSDSVGTPVVVLAAIGVVWMLRRAPARALLLLAFPVPFLLFIMNTAPASRYLNPVLPFVALFAGWTLSRAASRLRARPVTFWLAVAAAAAPALLGSIRAGQFLRQDDTRMLAERYVERHIPPGTSLAIQPHSVMFTSTRESLVEALSRQTDGVARASTKFQLQLSLDPYPAPAYRLIYLGRGGLDPDKIYIDYAALGGPNGLRPLRSAGVAFVVVKRYNVPDPAILPFLAALAREGRRIAAFSPYKPGATEAEQARIDPFLHNTDTSIDEALERPGPTLEIWELNGPGS